MYCVKVPPSRHLLMTKGETVHLRQRTPERHASSTQGIKVKITRNKTPCTLLEALPRTQHGSRVFLPKRHNLDLLMGHSRRTQIKGHSTPQLTGTRPKGPGRESQGDVEGLPGQEETKGTSGCRMGVPGRRKDIGGKTSGIQIRCVV